MNIYTTCLQVSFPPAIPFQQCKFPRFVSLKNSHHLNTLEFDEYVTDLRNLFFCEISTSSGSNQSVTMSLENPCSDGFKKLMRNTTTTSEAVRVGRFQGDQLFWATLIGNIRNETRAERARQMTKSSFASSPPNVHLLAIDCNPLHQSCTCP